MHTKKNENAVSQLYVFTNKISGGKWGADALSLCYSFSKSTLNILYRVDPKYFRTYRQNCPAEIKFGLSDDLQQLQVKSIVDEHNHEVSEVSIIIINI